MPAVRPALDSAAPIAPRADSAASTAALGEERPAFSATLDAMHARADRLRSSAPHHGNARPATTREDDDDTRADAATRDDNDTSARRAAASGAEAAVAMHAETAPSSGAGADSSAADATREADSGAADATLEVALFDVTASATPTTTAASAAAASADTTAAPPTPPAPTVTEATIATTHAAVLAAGTALRDQSGAARATSIDAGATPAAIAGGDASTDTARAEAAPDDYQREPGGTSAANAADDADGAAASRARGPAAPSDPTASASPADAAEEATNAQQSHGSKAERWDELAPRDSTTQRAAAAAAPSDLTASASPADAAEEATNAQQSHGSEAERRDEVAPGDSTTQRAATSEGKAQAADDVPAGASAPTADATPPDERIQGTRGETTSAATPAPAARDAAGMSSAVALDVPASPTALRANPERSAGARHTIAAAHDRHQHGREGTDAAQGVAQGSAGDGTERQGGRTADGRANHDAANGTSTRADARERAGRFADVPTQADAATSLARGMGADGAAMQERSTTDPTAAAGDASSRSVATAANGRDAAPALAARADGTPAPARGGATAASPWAERVVESVRIATLRGGGEMRLRLEPAGLGHIDVRITLAHDGIHAAIVAEHDSTRALLSNEQHLLHAALERSDMRLAGFSVDLGFGASSNAFDDAKRGAAGFDHVATAAPEADNVTIDHVAAAPSAPGHLSVRV